MSTQGNNSDRIALLQGTLDVLILRTLLFGRQHGQGIARAIQQTSDDVYQERSVRETCTENACSKDT